mgnify:CR=1 FL=1
MRARAVVRLRFPSERHLSIVLTALKPETQSASTSRARFRLESEGRRLTMMFEADDTSALRAAMNSYLHWIALVNDACSVLESLSK